MEHAKVLKIIFSLCKKLLRLPADDARKEFLKQELALQKSQTRGGHEVSGGHPAYDSSGSSGPDFAR